MIIIEPSFLLYKQVKLSEKNTLLTRRVMADVPRRTRTVTTGVGGLRSILLSYRNKLNI